MYTPLTERHIGCSLRAKLLRDTALSESSVYAKELASLFARETYQYNEEEIPSPRVIVRIAFSSA